MAEEQKLKPDEKVKLNVSFDEVIDTMFENRVTPMDKKT